MSTTRDTLADLATKHADLMPGVADALANPTPSGTMKAWMAAHDGQIGFLDQTGFELGRQLTCRCAVKGKEQHARSASVKAMGGVNPPPDLVAQELDSKARFAAVDIAAVDEQARRLVDGDQALIPVEDAQRQFGSGWWQCGREHVSGGGKVAVDIKPAPIFAPTH